MFLNYKQTLYSENNTSKKHGDGRETLVVDDCLPRNSTNHQKNLLELMRLLRREL